MEIPSVFYMQALGERIEYLTSLLVDLDAYRQLLDLGCVFFDGYILYDPKTSTQLELDRYFLRIAYIKDWDRMNAIINAYTKVLQHLCNLNASTKCIEKFHQIIDIRKAFYQQLIRERVQNGLFVWWKNLNGLWKIKFTSFDGKWAYYNVYRLKDKSSTEAGRSCFDRMHLYLTEYDVMNDTHSIMFCEDLFEDMRKELGYFG